MIGTVCDHREPAPGSRKQTEAAQRARGTVGVTGRRPCQRNRKYTYAVLITIDSSISGKAASMNGDEADRLTGALGDAGDDQVGAGADERAVAAQAGAERQRPPERHQPVRTAEGRAPST